MNRFRHEVVRTDLVERAVEGKRRRLHGIHGLPHWLRVERNGLHLARETGGDAEVVSLFALFHDARRINDFEDPGHGKRGALLAEELFAEGLLHIGAGQLKQLVYACEFHTDRHHTEDITIGCCWDADRLDLPRVGIEPDPALLNTEEAKQIAAGVKPIEGRFFRF